MLAGVSPGIAKPPGEKILFAGTAHKKFCGDYIFLFIHCGIVWKFPQDSKFNCISEMEDGLSSTNSTFPGKNG